MKKVHLLSRTLITAVSMSGVCFFALSAQAVQPQGDGAVIICPYLPQGMEAPVCDGKPATCVGTDSHDLIWGTDSADVIVAGAGNDVVQGDSGDDTICGGEGNDAIHGARGDDRIFGEEGDDWLFGAMDNDTLFGGPGDFDVLWGGPGYDELSGGPGDRDVCLKQREGAEVDLTSCETVHPPIGYKHDDEHELSTGIIAPR
jgi:Ca2+-binding RTX toxin-like protein